MALVFDKCCFCIDLRVGSLIIGYIGLIGSIILTLLAIVGLAASTYVVAAVHDEEGKAQAVGGLALALFCIILLIVLLYLIFNIVLLVGLHKHKRGHVKAYLIFSTIFIVLSILSFIGTITTGGSASDIVKSLLTILLSIYFLLVIRSYYLQMDDPTKRPAVYNTA